MLSANFSSSHETRTFLVNYGCMKEIVVCKNMLKDGWESSLKKYDVSKEEIQRISLSRSKRYIKEIALCNDFKYFYTQTISSDFDRFDLDSFKSKILLNFKKLKRVCPSFKYLIIFERHKNGAFHCHGLLSGIENYLYFNENNHLNLKFLDEIGFNSVQKIKDKQRVSSYIQKYITKDVVKTSSGVSYFHSRGLNLAERIEIDSFKDNQVNFKFENDFVKVYEVVLK